LKPLRILIIQETSWPDRYVNQQHHLGERLARRGHQVDIIDYDILWPTRGRQGLWQPRQVFRGISRVLDDIRLDVVRPAIIRLPMLCHVSWTASSLVELNEFIEERRPDVVLGLTLTNSYLMALLLRRTRIPYISAELEPWHTMVPVRWLRPLARFVERLALRAANHVVVFAPRMQHYMDGMGVQRERITVLGTGIDLDRFGVGTDGAAQRAAYGIGPDDKVLFFMGLLYPFSGLREIITAVADDPALLNGSKLLIAGHCYMYDELKEFVQRRGIDGKVRLIGPRPYEEMPALLAASDVCLLPFLENDITRHIVPIKVYEYLAAGRPVVSTPLPGMVAEFGADSGILYADDPLDVLRKAATLCYDHKSTDCLGKAGRRHVEQKTDWERIMDRFEALLMSLCSNLQEHHA
jgi:glycosyltransferase involved in cell wall biosynthesis